MNESYSGKDKLIAIIIKVKGGGVGLEGGGGGSKQIC